jgi:tRNA (uracil-5-)-methyltransferase TRM9
VNQATISKLLELNHLFYQTLALQFSSTRQRLQPGVARLLASLPPGADILDLGCGNGELARELAHRGHQGAYTGLDFSAELLSEARHNLSPSLNATFHQADLASPSWDEALPLHRYDVILALAVLHHLPGRQLRRDVLQTASRRLATGGRFIHSEWQFLNSPRLRRRLQPWESAGLADEDVEAGDYLLDWRQGGYGLRYVHHFSPEELGALANETGFTIRETFLSDGAGGKLGLYQVWEYNYPDQG